MDQDSSVGIATRYGLEGPGIESRRKEVFCSLYRPALGPTQPPIQWYRVIPGVKRPKCGVNHPPLSTLKVKERVQLYIYSLFGPSWPVTGRTLPFFTQIKCVSRFTIHFTLKVHRDVLFCFNSKMPQHSLNDMTPKQAYRN